MVLSDATTTAGLRSFATAAGPILDQLADLGDHLTAEEGARTRMGHSCSGAWRRRRSRAPRSGRR